MFENEVVHCFRGRADEDIPLNAFDPSEVEAVTWRSLTDVAAEMARLRQDYAPWFHIYLERHHDPGDAFTLLS